MSIFSELLPKISAISNGFTKSFNDELKAALECFDKFEQEFQKGRGKTQEKTQKDKNPTTTLQSIHEDDDEAAKVSVESEKSSKERSNNNTDAIHSISSADSNTDKPQRASKKRSKQEVDGIYSPEQDKRQKRNASVKAQGIISKQVNQNLTQKLRREDSGTKSNGSQHHKDDDKENTQPLLNIEIKQEKVSLPTEPEPMEMESLPPNIEIKEEMTKDEIAMPPPVAPVPKSRAKPAPKEKPSDVGSEEESSNRRRTTRTRKQTDTAPAPVAASRSTRSRSRSTKQAEVEEPAPPPAETRPKRTRGKKKVSEVTPEPEKEAVKEPLENGTASPAEKPRPKRTRRAQKAAEKLEQKSEISDQVPTVAPKEESVSQSISSPIITQSSKETKKHPGKGKSNLTASSIKSTIDNCDALDKTRVLEKPNDCGALDNTKVLEKPNSMDKTVVLPNGVYNHQPVTPKNVRQMNETVVLEAATRETIVLDKPKIMDCTVVLDRDPRAENITDDHSLLTDDSDPQLPHTPPKQEPPKIQPSSAVKEKVQQFEEMATRLTRTKTRAMAKKEDDPDTHTPPDKIIKPVLSAETLTKMNNMIFNGKHISSSACKPRSNIPTASVRPAASSASKLSAVNKAREEAEAKLSREDARKKKEAMLEAKREMQKRKREEKMAAAAAAREAAERERQLAMEAAARERMEKQAHADIGKQERLKEAERKRLELARKVAETEERRRAEEQARQQRLAEEQKKADEIRKKQKEEAAAMKKEAALMAKEIEKRQKEYIEKQKLKRMEEKTPTSGWHGSALEPVHMADGFQYLHSDEDEDDVVHPQFPVPAWSSSKARKQQLSVQTLVRFALVEQLFGVRVHSPDLRDIFPGIERARLKRTSSAVWRTPPAPARLPALHE